MGCILDSSIRLSTSFLTAKVMSDDKKRIICICDLSSAFNVNAGYLNSIFQLIVPDF